MRQIINITNLDQDIIEHLKRQDNISRYVIRCIRNDMRQGSTLEDQIKKILERLLQDKDISVKNTSQIDTEIQNSIASILNT